MNAVTGEERMSAISALSSSFAALSLEFSARRACTRAGV